jgi:hypothetical protein
LQRGARCHGRAATQRISVALAPKVKPPQIMAAAPITFGDHVRQAITESVGVAKGCSPEYELA